MHLLQVNCICFKKPAAVFSLTTENKFSNSVLPILLLTSLTNISWTVNNVSAHIGHRGDPILQLIITFLTMKIVWRYTLKRHTLVTWGDQILQDYHSQHLLAFLGGGWSVKCNQSKNYTWSENGLKKQRWLQILFFSAVLIESPSLETRFISSLGTSFHDQLGHLIRCIWKISQSSGSWKC